MRLEARVGGVGGGWESLPSTHSFNTPFPDCCALLPLSGPSTWGTIQPLPPNPLAQDLLPHGPVLLPATPAPGSKSRIPGTWPPQAQNPQDTGVEAVAGFIQDPILERVGPGVLLARRSAGLGGPSSHCQLLPPVTGLGLPWPAVTVPTLASGWAAVVSPRFI